MIALGGATGSGKTTLVNLLPAFYELSSGRITIDGQDITEVALESLRSRVSVVSQEAFCSTALCAKMFFTENSTPARRSWRPRRAPPIATNSSPACPKATIRAWANAASN